MSQDYDLPIDFSENPYYEKKFCFYDRKLTRALNSKDPHVMEFFLLLSLCHTIMPEEKEGRYSAESSCLLEGGHSHDALLHPIYSFA